MSQFTDPDWIGTAIGTAIVTGLITWYKLASNKPKKTTLGDLLQELQANRQAQEDTNQTMKSWMHFQTDLTVNLVHRAAIVVDRSNMMIRSANESAHELFGWLPGQLIGRSLEVLLMPSYRGAHRHNWERFWMEPIARPMAPNRTLQGIKADGTPIGLHIALMPNHDFVVAQIEPDSRSDKVIHPAEG